MVAKALREEVAEMRAMADMLVPYTFPVVDFRVEQDVLLFKHRSFAVDGYDLSVCFSKADYGEYFLESFQVQSSFAPFLPFAVVCKVGRAFLGSNNLSYIEFFKNNRKVYCWTIRSREGRPLPPDKKNKPGSYEGFQFSILQPGTVDLF
jgi:hypothetical protein